MLWGLLTFTSLAWTALAVICFFSIGWITSQVNGGAQGPNSTSEQAGGKPQGGSGAKASSSAGAAGASGSSWTGGGAGGGTSGAGGEGGGEDDDEGGEGEEANSSSFGEVRLKVLQVAGATGEIARILKARDWYAVLDVPREVEGTEIKKAYRTKQMATHPDKNVGAPGAHEASQRVNLANETLSNEVHRKQYDMRLADEEQYGPRSKRREQGANSSAYEDMAKAFDDFVKASMPPPPEGALYPTIDPSAYDTWGDAKDHSFRMACSCGYDHMATKVPSRSAQKARLCNCSSCGSMFGCMLSARDNDVWFEASNNVLKYMAPERFIKAYRCVGVFVYDITPWAKCNSMLVDPRGNPAPTNVHYIPFRLMGNGSSRGPKQQAKKDAGYGYNQFKGKGVNSHKLNNGKKKKKK